MKQQTNLNKKNTHFNFFILNNIIVRINSLKYYKSYFNNTIYYSAIYIKLQKNILKQKRPKCKSGSFSGADGSRTRVQTSSKTAFYMLSFLLFVGFMPVKNQPTYFLFSKISFLHRDFVKTIPSFMILLSKR